MYLKGGKGKKRLFPLKLLLSLKIIIQFIFTGDIDNL